MSERDFKKRQINFLEDQPDLDETREFVFEPKNTNKQTPFPTTATPSSPKRRNNKRKKISYFFIFLIIILGLLSKVLATGNNNFLGGIKNSYLIRQLVNIISPGEKYLAGEKEDRINFLLLGMGGPGHSGPYLTDTIILASFQPSTKKASMISIPRDMIVPVAPNDYKKINSVYAIAKRDYGEGGEFIKEVVSKTFDIPIHYFVAVDFNGFVEIVDAIGGIEVEVDRSFVDYQFPTADYKYQEVAFEAGEQKMDGLTALRFARSRHGNNGEGSDFARSKRQQKILTAAKDKITSFNTLINPQKITSLFSLFNQYTTTDLEPWEAVKLVHIAKGLDSQKVIVQSIDNREGGFLKAGIALDGAYILQPVTGNFEQMQQFAKNIFDLSNITDEKAKIVIQNGTKTPGLAAKAVNHLNQMGYQVLRYGNAIAQDKIVSTVYDYTGNKPATKKTLEAIFETEALTDIPFEYSNTAVTETWNIKDEQDNFEQLDFLIVLGVDQDIVNTEIVTTVDPGLFVSSTTSTIEQIDL